MRVKIEYKSDGGDIPYCAFTNNATPNSRGETYECGWSGHSFEEAKSRLVATLKKRASIVLPLPEEIEVEV